MATLNVTQPTDGALTILGAVVIGTLDALGNFVQYATVSYKNPVRVATTANGTLATAFANGQTVDGIVLATGDRILLKNQSAPADNGIYVVAASGAPARASDMDTWTEVPGSVVGVLVGTANADTAWLCTSDSGGTIGVTAINFSQFGVGGIGGTTGTTDNAITRADGTGGSTLQGSLATINDAGGIAGTTLQITAGLLRNATQGINGIELVDTAQSGFVDFAAARLWSHSGIVLLGSTFLVEDAANTLALRNGTNGQSWIVSRTFTDGSNYSQFKTVVTGSVVAFTVSEAGTGVGTLTGYTFDKAVLAPNIPIADTGWTANADNGDKTAVIPTNANVSVIGAALDILSAGSGALLVAVANKVKALEGALVTIKLPNA